MTLLTGKTIVITGASSGIGKQTAIYLSQLGASLALVARRVDKLEEVVRQCDALAPQCGAKHKIYPYDLTEPDGIAELVKQIARDLGPISGLVYSAGITIMRPLKVIRPEHWQKIMQLNVFSFTEMVKDISKGSIADESASFLAISAAASLCGAKSQTLYAASKASLEAWVRCAAKELAAKNFRVNALRPGFVRTEMYQDYCENWKESGRSEKENFPKHLLGIVEPKEVAAMAAFLMGTESKTITGSCINIDSGLLS